MHKVDQVSCGKDFTIAVVYPKLNDYYHQQQEDKNTLTSVGKTEVYAWGNNQSGQLGLPEIHSQTFNPTRIAAFDALEDDYVTQVSCGTAHTLFLTVDQDVVSCGQNAYGECGFDPAECDQTSTPFKVAALDGIQIAQIAAGVHHSLYLTQEGQVFASGNNSNFQLGIGDDIESTETPVPISSLENIVRIEANMQSAAVSNQGELYLWGRGIFGDYPYPQKILTVANAVVDVSLGNSVSVAVDEKGIAWSWGSNQAGELGVGDQEPRIHPFPVLSLKGKVVSKVKCGEGYVICLGSQVRKQIPNLNLATASTSNATLPKAGFEKPQYQKSHKNPSDKSTTKNSVRRASKHAKKSSRSNISADVAGRHRRVPLPTGVAHKKKKSIDGSRNGQSAATLHSHKRSYSNGRPMSQDGRSKLKTENQPITLNPVVQRTKKHSKKDQDLNHVNIVNLATSNGFSREQMEKTITNSVISPPAEFNLTATLQAENLNLKKQVDEFQTLIKQLKKTAKAQKDENKVMRKEHFRQAQQIEKLDKALIELKQDPINQKIVQGLQNDLKKSEMKLKKMKDKRLQTKELKDTLQAQNNQMKEHNISLMKQMTKLESNFRKAQQDRDAMRAKYEKMVQMNESMKNDLEHFQEQFEAVRDEQTKNEQRLRAEVAAAERALKDSKEDYKFITKQNTDLTEKVTQQQREILGREGYVCSLENEVKMLREEIKTAKFTNEKHGYDKFVGGLTVLRKSTERNRTTVNRSVSQEKSTTNNNRHLILGSGTDSQNSKANLNHEVSYVMNTKMFSPLSANAKSCFNGSNIDKMVQQAKSPISPSNVNKSMEHEYSFNKNDSQVKELTHFSNQNKERLDRSTDSLNEKSKFSLSSATAARLLDTQNFMRKSIDKKTKFDGSASVVMGYRDQSEMMSDKPSQEYKEKTLKKLGDFSSSKKPFSMADLTNLSNKRKAKDTSLLEPTEETNETISSGKDEPVQAVAKELVAVDPLQEYDYKQIQKQYDVSDKAGSETGSLLPANVLDKPIHLKIYENETDNAPSPQKESAMKNLRDKYNQKLLQNLELRAKQRSSSQNSQM